MGQARLRSSFIYLANAVKDLSGNWATLALVLAPLVLASSLCVLPDALNVQARVATGLAGGGRSVEFHPVASGAVLHRVQEPYRPEISAPPDPYPRWLTRTLHVVAAVITVVAVNLVVLCLLASLREGGQARGVVSESIEAYRRAIHLSPAFLWVAALQIVPTVIGLMLFVIPGALVFLWLYFAQFALVFDDRHGFLAITRSYELIRGRFLRVSIRILVFVALLSGYTAWTSLCFVLASHFLGPVAVYTGFVWGTVFALDVLWVAVAYATTAFFLAAGARLYRDLTELARERALAEREAVAAQATGPLGATSAS